VLLVVVAAAVLLVLLVLAAVPAVLAVFDDVLLAAVLVAVVALVVVAAAVPDAAGADVLVAAAVPEAVFVPDVAAVLAAIGFALAVPMPPVVPAALIILPVLEVNAVAAELFIAAGATAKFLVVKFLDVIFLELELLLILEVFANVLYGRFVKRLLLYLDIPVVL